MHPQPLPTIAAPHPGGGGDGFRGDEKKINLDLGIGSSACASEVGLKRIVQEKREYFFSDAQFHELCNQIFIYNSIAYGFAIPFHLLLPIWMSVFKSLGPAIYKTYPSFSGFTSDRSGLMDSEPGRCKRTDGRKWRCSKNVVPLQKYCERHMHRGRQGSRKHVEPIQRVSSHDNRTYRSGFLSSQKSIGVCNVGNGARSACSSSRADFSTSGGGDGKPSFLDTNCSRISGRKQTVARSNCVGFNSPRFGLSPKSVLIASGKVGLSSGCTTIIEGEPQRCRRTDGKKWQCRRDSLPNQKYCEAHMHRGAKRVVNPEVSRSFETAAHRSCATTDGINLNTIPASPQHVDSSSSMSDATTITDENISFCVSNSLHNG